MSTPVEEVYEMGKALLGKGIYTNVHLAKEKKTGRLVAIKQVDK